ncbi:MAG: hypothetical protein JWP98_1465, partial [Edaphobacter sp.]|nr:hypothetical protein [Edaphobacter sp.]
GLGASGVPLDGALGLAGSPGNGNSSAGEGFFVSGAGGQGLSAVGLPEVWFAGVQGGLAGF